jgi:hypothetical protein
MSFRSIIREKLDQLQMQILLLVDCLVQIELKERPLEKSSQGISWWTELMRSENLAMMHGTFYRSTLSAISYAEIH